MAADVRVKELVGHSVSADRKQRAVDAGAGSTTSMGRDCPYLGWA